MNLLTIDVLVAPADRRDALERDVRTGLTSRPKTLSPVWFYDTYGSELFDEITRLPEYYLTRAERSILAARAGEIVVRSGADTLVELGSGTSEKTLLLLDAMADRGSLRRFIPFDVSEEVLRSTAADISRRYGVEVHAVVGDFHRHLSAIPGGGRRLVAFLGSTIGNLTPTDRRRFYFDLRATMQSDDRLLLGTDLVKAPERLHAAYDDASGVTAAFNRNVLAVLNAELHADFDPLAFDHLAVWNPDERRMEMRLRARSRQIVRIADLDLEVGFGKGEDLLTEISSKFTPKQVEQELAVGGFALEQAWTDGPGDFLVSLARA
jgi:L-histidine N-alpha-methyltransferase